MRRTLLSLAVVAAACNTPQTRTLQGRTSQQALIIDETAGGQQTTTATDPDGNFKLEVQTEHTMTLLVGFRDASGKVKVVSHIGPAWFRLHPGEPINLGLVEVVGMPSTTPAQTCTSTTAGRADLPYDAKLGVGQTWRLADAFAEKGAQPARVVSVTMDGSSWRLTELQTGAAFTVTQADCDHAGNRDVGRDRAVITWQNADGSRETDHLDLRYCESGSGSSSGEVETESHPLDDSSCGEVEHEGCGDDRSHCDDDSALEETSSSACPGEVAPTLPAGGTGPIN